MFSCFVSVNKCAKQMVIENINNNNNIAMRGSVLANSTRALNDAATPIKHNIVRLNQLSLKKQARLFLRWIPKHFSSPHQRAILGITALCTQPFIDLHNKHIKKEDKPVAVARTIAKIIVGTTVGICLRAAAIKAVKNFTKTVSDGKYSQCLLPKHVVEKLAKNPKSIVDAYLLNYRNGLGTFIGTMGGLFMNFLVDAPLSKKLTNVIHDKVFKEEKANVK